MSTFNYEKIVIKNAGLDKLIQKMDTIILLDKGDQLYPGVMVSGKDINSVTKTDSNGVSREFIEVDLKAIKLKGGSFPTATVAVTLGREGIFIDKTEEEIAADPNGLKWKMMEISPNAQYFAILEQSISANGNKYLKARLFKKEPIEFMELCAEVETTTFTKYFS